MNKATEWEMTEKSIPNAYMIRVIFVMSEMYNKYFFPAYCESTETKDKASQYASDLIWGCEWLKGGLILLSNDIIAEEADQGDLVTVEYPHES